MAYSTGRRGLTLVELLVAMTLAAVLLVSVIGVIARLTLTRAYLLEHAPVGSWEHQTAERLRVDVMNSHFLDISSRELRCVGFGGERFATGEPVHDRSVVSYHIALLGERRWLLRTVHRLDARLGHDVNTELVCPDISRLDLQLFDASRGGWSTVIWKEEKMKRLRVPSVCRIVILKERQPGGESMMEEVLDCVIATACSRVRP